jgi:Amt family ammonium transporter
MQDSRTSKAFRKIMNRECRDWSTEQQAANGRRAAAERKPQGIGGGDVGRRPRHSSKQLAPQRVMPDDATLAGVTLDTPFVLQQGALVVAMSAGFALLEVGSVSVRNTQNILFKNLLSPTLAAVCFWLCGYTFAFGNSCGAEHESGFIGGSCYWGMAEGMWLTAPSAQLSSAGNSSLAADWRHTLPMPDAQWYASWFFHWAFCATASTIVSGAVAERIHLTVYAVITVALTSLIYPVVAHWVWAGDGWAHANAAAGRLFDVGVVDFAGGGVVHMVGGVAALVSAWMIGPRHGRFVKHYHVDGHWYAKTAEQPLTRNAGVQWMEVVESAETASGEEWRPVEYPFDLVKLDEAGKLEEQGSRWVPNSFPSNSSTFQTFGTLILWFGWYGFNCGSTMGVTGGQSAVAAKVAVTTTLSAAGGALSAGSLSALQDDFQDLSAMSNGLLAGLASITACCAVVEPWAAFVVGIVGGALFFYSARLLDRLRIDDVVLAVPVHLVCGGWGLVSVGIFASPLSYAAAFPKAGNLSCGVLYAGAYGCDLAGSQLAAQLVFVVAVASWVGSTTLALLFCCKLVFARFVVDSMGNKFTGSNSGFRSPLAYDRLAQMYGIDMMKHGGLSGAELMTVHKSGEEAESDPRPVNTLESVGPATMASAGQILSSWPPVSRRPTVSQLQMTTISASQVGGLFPTHAISAVPDMLLSPMRSPTPTTPTQP